jgi:tetratricopeptide (TPR) repeat protein
MGRLCEALPADPRRLAELHIRRAIHARRASDYQSVINEVQNAIQLIETNPDIGAAAFTLLVDGYLLWGRALSMLGDNVKAHHQLERALSVSRAYRYPQGECGAQNLLGIVHWAAGNYAEANDHLNEALPIARATGDLRRECETLQNLGIVASDEHRFTDAISYYQQAQQITQRTGDRAAETGLLANLGNLHHDMLDYEQARDYSARAAQMAADLNDRMMQTIALINLGEVERELGQYALAEADTARAHELARAIGYRRGEAITLANRAHITLALRQTEQSLRLGREALELAREIGSRYAQDQATQVIGRVLLESNCWTDAESHYSTALSEWQTYGDATLLIEGRVGLAAAALGRSSSELGVDEIVGHLLGSASADASRHLPLWVFLQAARALLARQDSRAAAIISRAQTELASRASRIKDDAARQSYLNAPEHVAICQLA